MNLGYFFASLNACLNGLAGLLLLAGWFAIRGKNEQLHRRLMGSAFIVSILFLASYLTRFYLTGVHRYEGEGLSRQIYLAILITHTPLAAAVPFLAVWSIRLAQKRNIIKHRKVAKITFPIWMYVSVTGVLIYWMLYHYHPVQAVI